MNELKMLLAKLIAKANIKIENDDTIDLRRILVQLVDLEIVDPNVLTDLDSMLKRTP